MAIFIQILKPIFQAQELIITYGLKPFDICESNAKLWQYIKIMYIITFFTSNLICSNFVYNKIPIKKKIEKHLDTKDKDDKLKLLIGYNQKTKEKIYIPKSGLFQNFLITGTIGSGKTSSAMYPFTKQLIKYNYLNPNSKIGMLILDVKGNYYNQVKKYVKKYNLEDDLIVIELKSKITYNPLNKPSLKPIVLANRLKTILELFSENNSESYWLDKAEQILAEAIKLCRIYNDGYVTFKEIHNLITIPNHYKEKIQKLKELFILNKLSLEQIYELNMALNFFEREFQSLDPRTSSILKSEITRITNTFISDYNVLKTFSPERKELTFLGFEDVIKNGKIVVLNMNIAEYKNLSKIIAAYLKLDFQTEIMKNLNNNNERITAFICDEYAEYVTKTDSDFFALSREAKCINIVSTQSYSSLKNTLKDETSVKVICQNLINKIWFRTDDIFTIEEAQKQLGKEEKEKISKNISESAKKTRYNYLTKSLVNKDSSISESLNIYTQNDYVYDTNFFTLELETFNSLCFLSDGNKILKPTKIRMYPYFLEEKEELL
ncbi:MAG: type IV secretory system conjugative DNA transfer family protein [Clostridia bacterium]